MGNKAEKIISKITEWVKYIYVVHIILAFCVYTTETWITSITPLIVVGLSAIVLLYRLKELKKTLRYPLIGLYIVFVLLYGISSLYTMSYGLVGNIKVLMWMTIQIGVLYLCDTEKTYYDIKKELTNCLIIIIAMTTIMNVIGLGMLFNNYITYRPVNEQTTHIIGITYWGRLYGLHTDPNYGAVQTIVAIMSLIYLWLKDNVIWKKVLMAVCLIINMMHLSFSGSRTGLVALTVSGALFAFIYSFQKHNKILKSLLYTILAVVVVVGSNVGISKGYNQVTAIISDMMHSDDIENGDEVQEENEFIEIGREEELSNDVSNRRFDLWKNAIEISGTSPLIGISFANIVEYCKVNLPNSYLLTNGLTVFSALHNMFMDLLVSQGWIGVVLFVAIILLSLRYIFINLNKIRKEDVMDCCFLFSTAAGVLCSSVFVSQILYVHTPGTVLFWLLWGYLICYVCKGEKA